MLEREENCVEKIYSLHILASKLNQKLSEASLSKMDDLSYLHLWKLHFTTFYEIDDSGKVNELMKMVPKNRVNTILLRALISPIFKKGK